MPDSEKPAAGSIPWRDLTVPDAEGLKDFYSAVVGWESEAVDMDGYSDFCMMTPTSGETVAGICHARGANEDLPPQWLVYILVDNLDDSIAACGEGGGSVIAGPRPLEDGRFCVIRDPAGAVCALFQAADG